MKYKVGDKVRVRKNLKVGEKYDGCFFVSNMGAYRGKIVEIIDVFEENNCYRVNCVKGDTTYYWSEEMFEPVITNFDKLKEEFVPEDLIENNGFCRLIHKMKKEEYCEARTCQECVKWLNQLYKEPKDILDEQEKEYLSAVIKPFRNRIKYIKKIPRGSSEYIGIYTTDDVAFLPYFKRNSMYEGMELEREYTLKELGL